jgi:hypothetical protein
MHKPFRLLLPFLAVLVVLASCSKKVPKEAKYIPKDATITLAVNPKSLEDKMKSGIINLDSFIKKFQSEGDTLDNKSKKEWEDFKNSGINLENNIFFFAVQKGSMQKGQTSAFSVMASLKDNSKFEAYTKQQSKLKNKTLTKGKGFSYIDVESNTMLSWNEDVVMLTMYNKESKMEFDTAGNYRIPDMSETKAELQKEVERYFNEPETESVASLESFKEMFKTKADGYMFGTSSAALAYLSATPLNLPKLQELLKDNYSVTTFNFEDGKIVAKGTSYTNPMLSSILKKYAGPTVNLSALEKFPAQNINGAMLASFNPELFNGLLKELEVSGMVDIFLSKQGIASADLYKALKGEINVVLGDFAMVSKPKNITMPDGSVYPDNSSKPQAKLLITAPIGDKAAFNKIMDLAVQSSGGVIQKTATGYKGGATLDFLGLYLQVDDKNLVIASDSTVYSAYLAGAGKPTIEADVLDKLKGKSTIFYVGISSIMKSLLATEKQEETIKVQKIVDATFKDVFITADNFDGKGVSSAFEVRMTDAKQNSLVSLMNMVQQMNDIKKAERKKLATEYMPDNGGVTVEPVAPNNK